MNNLYKAYVYLWHMLDPDKAQYSKEIVGTHDFAEPSEHAGMTQMEDDQVQVLLDMPAFDTFNEMCRWAYEQGCWATFKNNYAMWRDQFIERNRNRLRVYPEKQARYDGEIELNDSVGDPFETGN